jgi:hypothetical protein
LQDDAQVWQALDQVPFVPGAGGAYNNWRFPIDQQVLLIPDADQGVQIVINSLDNMEHPFHLQYVPIPYPLPFTFAAKLTTCPIFLSLSGKSFHL